MLEMLGDIAIGLVLFVVGVLLVFIGIPKHGQQPRFLRFEASLVVYPAVIMVFLVFGVAMMLRGVRSEIIRSKTGQR
jgi:predicted permease